jgi:cysteine desulfurase
MNKSYFFDNSSTTRPYKEVVDKVSDVMYNYYGNPSSIHELGQDAKHIIEYVRSQIAEDINCEPNEIIFVSGACEANSLSSTALNKIFTTKLEHKSIELAFKNPLYFHNDQCGNIILDNYALCKLRTHNWLVSVCGANSEIGVIQDIRSISEFVHKYNNILHVDATQLYPEQNIDVRKLGIDLMSVSAQKFHGPRGVGFLYCKNGIKLRPLIYGSQENFKRGGTYNTPAIAGMGKALELTRNNQDQNNSVVKNLRDELASKLLLIPNVSLNGPNLNDNRLVNNLSLCIDGVKANDLVTMASMYHICISAGSACSSGEAIPSSTLKAIGLTDSQALSSIRISLSHLNTEEEIDYVSDMLPKIISRLRQ